MHHARSWILAGLLTLIGGLGLVAVPAQADDATPTTTYLHQTYSPDGTTTQLRAVVRSAHGTPTGSVLFVIAGDPTPLGPPVTLDATGTARLDAPIGPGATPYQAVFTGTSGYADSSGDAPIFGESVVMKPIGSILALGPPTLLKVTLTYAVRATYASDGSPATGEEIDVTSRNVEAPASGHPQMSPGYVFPVDVCTAFVDESGLATCKGTALLSTIVTVLTTPVWANHPLFPLVESTKVPILTVG
ncbi:MAG TPA: Ig-like domain-containing protein [Marmoricola sp.]|jgi:hypothetical protein|nr:Ig-like domain-containing protein [Marmoricola sp.]